MNNCCPICKSSIAFNEGERVDVGFGPLNGPKCSPDYCEDCGYVESGANPNDLPFCFFEFCFKHKIDHKELKPYYGLTRGALPDEYVNYINSLGDYGELYGKCREQCIAMMDKFPHLKCVYGEYFDSLIGLRSHFWLYDPLKENLLVDPTAAQFPTKGAGLYFVDYSIDPKTKIRLDYPQLEKTLFDLTGEIYKFPLNEFDSKNN